MAGWPFLRCLGQPVLFSPEGEPVRFRTKKHLALLVYLAVEPQKAHRRDRLAELLWPSAAMVEGRHSLATALSILRPRLGPGVLETSRDHVQLLKDRIELDIDRLKAGEILSTENEEALVVAGFLDGFDIPDAPEYSLWKDRKSASLLPAIKTALIKLIDACRRTADVRQIEQLADAMLAIDDLSEEAIRAKMEARAFAGDRLTALRIFENWKDRFKEAVGAQPSALVEGMAVRLRRRGWERTEANDIPTVPTDQWRGRLFVGRFDEYRRLYEAWEQSRRGRPCHALVLGDSGIGKTTLVNRLVTAAGLEGAVASRAQCYDLERDIPYAALGTLITGILELPGISATPPEVLAELARNFSAVRRKFPTIPPSEAVQGESARLRITDAFHQMLEIVAEEHPLILVIDDLHLCDEASLSILHLLMHRAGSGAPIMFVLVARTGELLLSPLALRLRSGSQSFGIREVELLPLSEADSNEVLAGLLGASSLEADFALRRAMIRLAGGFPMVLELLVQDWEVNGRQSLTLALDSMTAELSVGGEATDLYRQVLDRMACALDPSTRNVLNVAAVLGHRLNDLDLYAIADVTHGQVMSAMTDLVRHRILRDNGRGLEFVNEFVRTAVYLEVPSPARRALHAAISERLESEKARGVPFLELEIAWHAVRAGQPTQVAKHLLEGAHGAIARGALDAAARALGSALSKLDTQSRVAAALLLAEVLQEQGRWGESASLLAAECGGETSGLGVVYSILAAHRTTTPTAEQLSRDVAQLHAIIGSDRSRRVRLQAVNAAAQLMADIRDRDMAGSLFQLADGIRDPDLSEDERAQLGLCRAQFLYFSGQQEAASRVLVELLEHFRSKGIANSRLVRVHSGLGAVHCYYGQYEAARAAYHEGHSLAVRLGSEQQQAILAAQSALCSIRCGEYKECLEWSREASLGERFTHYHEMQVAYHRAFALAMLGDPEGAIHESHDLESKIPSGGPSWLVQAGLLFTADILCLAGQHQAAVAQGRLAVGLPHPVLHAPSFGGAFARWLARSTECHERADALLAVSELSHRMHELDMLDRAEVTCARLMLSESQESEGEGLLRRILASLPPAVTTQLQRLGVLRLAA